METGSDTSHGDDTLDALNDLYNLLENPNRQSNDMSGPFLPYFQDQVCVCVCVCSCLFLLP